MGIFSFRLYVKVCFYHVKPVKVLIKLFQKFAVSKGGTFGRTPQSAKLLILRVAERGMNKLLYKINSEWGEPAASGSPQADLWFLLLQISYKPLNIIEFKICFKRSNILIIHKSSVLYKSAVFYKK